MDIRKVVGGNVRKYRARLGLSQEKLAEIAGLHRTYVSGVERGVRNPTVTIVDLLAHALKVHPTVLLKEDPPRRGKSLMLDRKNITG